MARKGRRSSHAERIQAMQLIAQGYTKREVAQILEVTEQAVYGWQKAYQEGGLAALCTKIASGRKRMLWPTLNKTHISEQGIISCQI